METYLGFSYVDKYLAMINVDPNIISKYRANRVAYYSMAEDNIIIAQLALHHGSEMEIHEHEFYEMLYIRKGEGIYTIDFKHYEFSDNTLFFIRPGQIHDFKNVKNNIEGFVLAFSEGFFKHMSDPIRKMTKCRLFISSNKSTCQKLNGEYESMISQELEILQKEYVTRKNMMGFFDFIAARLSILFLDIQNAGINSYEVDNESNYVYFSFIEFLEQNFRSMHAVKEYARALSFSLSTLDRHVREVSGKDPHDIICERIMLEAKRMLRYKTGMRIKDISISLGFEDTSNFIKFFKHYTGLTPVEFRNMD